MGVCRPSIPPGVLRVYEHEYPVAWLGILAAVAPSTDELIYSCHPRGFALHSLRTPQISRLYLQCAPDEQIEAWPDDRIWQELHTRLELAGWTLHEGPVLEKGITALRSFVVEPMQYGRLFLAGDAAHVVPATGAKGLNLAVADARRLAEALTAWYHDGRDDELAGYSAACLRRAWRVQHFSSWMTSLLHRLERRPVPGAIATGRTALCLHVAGGGDDAGGELCGPGSSLKTRTIVLDAYSSRNIKARRCHSERSEGFWGSKPPGIG